MLAASTQRIASDTDVAAPATRACGRIAMPTTPVNGISIYYEWHGAPSAPVLVLNNGILMNASSSWLAQTRAFARHYRVLQYDCRGQGQSTHPDGPYTMAQHADDLAGLLDALDVASAHVAGISYGGEVAQAFALAHPSRVRSLVLADTVSEVGPELRLIVEAWRDRAAAGDGDGLFTTSVGWNFSPAFVSAHAELLATARQRYALLDLPAVARLCDAFLDVAFTDRLAEICVPACIIVGDRDLLKGREYAELLHRSISGSELHVLASAGHAACVEQPEAFNTVVLGFLAKQPT